MLADQDKFRQIFLSRFTCYKRISTISLGNEKLNIFLCRALSATYSGREEVMAILPLTLQHVKVT